MGAPLLLALALFASPVRANDEPMFETLGRYVMNPGSYPPPAFSVPVRPGLERAPMKFAQLSFLMESGSGWQGGRLEESLGKAAAILMQCRVGIGPAEVHIVRWTPEGLRRLNGSTGLTKLTVMSDRKIHKRRPLGLLFANGSTPTTRGPIPSTALAYNASSARDLTPVFPEAGLLRDTFWITYDQEYRDHTNRKNDEQPSYSTFAHELTHVLGDVGHVDDSPNLMSNKESARDPKSKSADLTNEQCAAIRRFPGL